MGNNPCPVCELVKLLRLEFCLDFHIWPVICNVDINVTPSCETNIDGQLASIDYCTVLQQH